MSNYKVLALAFNILYLSLNRFIGLPLKNLTIQEPPLNPILFLKNYSKKLNILVLIFYIKKLLRLSSSNPMLPFFSSSFVSLFFLSMPSFLPNLVEQIRKSFSSQLNISRAYCGQKKENQMARARAAVIEKLKSISMYYDHDKGK